LIVCYTVRLDLRSIARIQLPIICMNLKNHSLLGQYIKGYEKGRGRLSIVRPCFYILRKDRLRFTFVFAFIDAHAFVFGIENDIRFLSIHGCARAVPVGVLIWNDSEFNFLYSLGTRFSNPIILESANLFIICPRSRDVVGAAAATFGPETIKTIFRLSAIYRTIARIYSAGSILLIIRRVTGVQEIR